MRSILRPTALFFVLLLPFTAAWADKYHQTITIFQNAGESGEFFKKSYGYAVFPDIGKAGFVVGGAHGDGRVYVNNKWVGNTSMTQVTAGFQLGGQVYSQIIFFEDERAFNEFTGGNFEFGADASAVAITAAASAGTSTEGSSATASGGKNDAATAGTYYKGMAVFTVAKGGLMYAATIGGQKYGYKKI